MNIAAFVTQVEASEFEMKMLTNQDSDSDESRDLIVLTSKTLGFFAQNN